MTDVFISKNDELCDRIADVLVGEGINAYLGGGKAELDECEYFLLVLKDDSDLNDGETTAAWQYFYNELKWKRKTVGEIVLLLGEAVTPLKLPFALRKCKSFSISAPSAAVKYIESGGLDKDEAQAAKKYAVKEIKYRPNEKSVQQIKYSQRAATVERFDGTVNTAKRVSGAACKEDHIYKELYSTKTEVKKGVGAQSQKPKSKKSFVGFSVVLLVLFMVVVVCVVVGLLAWSGSIVGGAASAGYLPAAFVKNL